MKVFKHIVDRLQAIFPPNRIMLFLAAPITAGSAWVSAWITTHVPGVQLPTGLIAGVVGAATLIAITLIYKWFDQWQKGEPIHVEDDLDQAIDEFLRDPESAKALAQLHPELFAINLDPLVSVGHAIEQLRGQVAQGSLTNENVAAALQGIGETLDEFVNRQHAASVAAPSST